MGKYLSIVLGLAAMALGAWGITVTWPFLWRALQAIVPVLLLVGGLLVLVVGISEVRDSRADQALSAKARRAAQADPHHTPRPQSE